jgi:hypothetical protein
VKSCKDCGVSKPIEDFYVNSGSKGGRLARCKACVLLRYADGRKARQRGLLDYIQSIKLGRGCTDCGYRGHPAALEFDHLPEFKKEYRVSVMAAGSTKAKIDAEIAKCEVVCANCHRVRTANRLSAKESA